MKFHVKFHGSFMEKITNKKNSQKKISMKFLVELKGTFMEFFWIRNYVNYQSELFTRVKFCLIFKKSKKINFSKKGSKSIFFQSFFIEKHGKICL